jgi:large subunit ribosomal protein L23
MKKIDLYNVLIKPIISEKSNLVAEKKEEIVFKVLKSATKQDIRDAFEMVFSVKVAKVSVINVKGKVKRFSRFTGRRSDWKKAYISLVPGQKFDLATNQK